MEIQVRTGTVLAGEFEDNVGIGLGVRVDLRSWWGVGMGTSFISHSPSQGPHEACGWDSVHDGHWHPTSCQLLWGL